MTEAYKNYHNTFMEETAALAKLLGGILNGSRTADEINRQAEQHFINLDNAAAKYYVDMQMAPPKPRSRRRTDKISRYEEYIQHMCRNGKYTPEEANQQALSRAVQKYYETEAERAPMLRHEFNCLSEA